MTSNPKDINELLHEQLEYWKETKAKCEVDNPEVRDVEYYNWYCREMYECFSKLYLRLDPSRENMRALVKTMIESAKDQLGWSGDLLVKMQSAPRK